ncbi:hypothetical protein [Piscinibacter gummiphilus]|uniref:Uncharacterized protein n=1 Tax=Piscinibacter gummiphilus TaxID=946333 RepID=A0A1W6LH90_9BURK|nr:hypothetical protein [Piscinibacter gummiphilus]ARN23586.1 hypothetical protein A4W93_28860 [Piscinibacter gummiphilus]ATU68294.1 hypothetical protein CPZ87_28995 [Piscinibacter gummiphilus]
MTTSFLVASIGTLIVYALWISVMVVSSPLLEQHQKIVQLVLVWLLPPLGTIAVHLIHRAQRQETPGLRAAAMEAQADQGVSPRDFANPNSD